MTTNDSNTPKKAESGIQDSPLSADQSLINLSSPPQVVQGQTAEDGRRHGYCHHDTRQDCTYLIGIPGSSTESGMTNGWVPFQQTGLGVP